MAAFSRRSVRAWCLAMCLISSALAKPIDLVLEHDLLGTFTKGGHIRGTLSPDGGSSLTLQREGWGDEDEAAFAELVQDNGFYRLRVPQSGDTVLQPLLFSVPARCLANAGPGEKLKVQATPDGAIVGVAYDAGGLRCAKLAKNEGSWAPAAESPVLVELPRRGPSVSVQMPGFEAGMGAGARGGAGPMGLLEQPTEQEGGSQAAAAGGEEAAPVPDQRTWFQKNWIFVLPAVMLGMNVFGAIMNPQGGEARPGAQNGRAAPQPRPRAR